MMKLIFIPLIFLLVLLIIIAAIAMAFVTGQPEPGPGFSIGINLCDEVLALKPLVLYHARYFGVEDYIWYLLAIIQVESGGRVEDVMQSSESLGLPPNSLSRDESIRQGVRYFSQLLSRAERLGADMDTVLQSYNFGIGFIDYVVANGGGQYSFELAMSFARRLSGGVRVAYTNAIAVAENGGWRYNYGNFFYVRLVRSHLVGIGSSGFLWPTPDSNLVTSPFGRRPPPGGIGSTNHFGIDIGAAWGTPILASAGGVVEFSGWNGGYGNYIRIYHGNGHHTVYAHNSRNHVRAGDRVLLGQHIADVGTTGVSTGPHLHFEIWVNGTPVDPLPFFPPGTYRF